MTSTPVSKPESPSASLGKSEQRGADHQERIAVRVEERRRQSLSHMRVMRDLHQPVPMTTMLSAIYTATSTTAMPIASSNP